MKRRRSIPAALLRLRALRASRRARREVRRVRSTFLGVMPNASQVDAANDSGK